jgi:4-hydroxybenzoate polyprenyltransferase
VTRGERRGIVALVPALRPNAEVSRALALGGRALRVRQWLHFVPLPLAGAPGLVSGACPKGPVLWACLAGALCLGCAYGINAHADRATDASRRKNPLVGVTASGWALAPALACGGLALAAAVPSGGVAAAAVSVVAGVVYSVGPRIKRWPVIGSLANVAIFAPLLLLVGGARPYGFWGMFVVFAALLLQNQLLHERADAAEDRRAGVRTSAQVLGDAGVPAVGRGLAGLGAAAAVMWLAWPGALAAIVGLALGAWLMGQAEPARARRRHRAVALATGAIVYAVVQGGGG